MKRVAAILISTLAFASPSLAQERGSLVGTWRQDDGKVTVRIAACPTSRDLCATVVDEKPDLSVPRRMGKIIVSDLKPAGSGRWNGQFVDQGTTMAARVRQTTPDTVSFKICAFAFLCDTKRFDRVRS